LNIHLSGFPALIFQIGFVVLLSAPVWLAARLVGARRPTLGRAVLALVLGSVGASFSLLTGPWALLLAPLSMLLAFKFVLQTSFFGAILLAVVAIAAYAGMIHLLAMGMAGAAG